MVSLAVMAPPPAGPALPSPSPISSALSPLHQLCHLPSPISKAVIPEVSLHPEAPHHTASHWQLGSGDEKGTEGSGVGQLPPRPGKALLGAMRALKGREAPGSQSGLSALKAAPTVCLALGLLGNAEGGVWIGSSCSWRGLISGKALDLVPTSLKLDHKRDFCFVWGEGVRSVPFTKISDLKILPFSKIAF